jgi:hypothetical protein
MADRPSASWLPGLAEGQTRSCSLSAATSISLPARPGVTNWPGALRPCSVQWPGIDQPIIGTVLPELPLHDELYRRVIALGGGVTQEVVRPLFEAVPVDSLPPFHNPARCRHHRRFGRMAAQQEPGSATPRADLAAGKAFLASLTPRDLRGCYYH